MGGGCVLAGLALAASFPPFGWWPAAFAGVALPAELLGGQPAAARFRRGWLVTVSLLLPTLVWIADLTLPGYLLACAFFAALFGLAFAVAVPPGAGRWLALPGAWVLAEAVRGAWPFGGVPLSTLSMGQAGGPLLPVARLGGSLLLVGLTVVAGVALAAALRRRWRSAGAAVLVVLVVLAVAAAAPSGRATGDRLDVALVQGGGPQGTRADETDERVVFERHLEASEAIQPPVELVLWPENVVNVEGPLEDNVEGAELATLTERLETTLVVGVVQGDAPADRFTNEAVAFGPDGRIVDRYEKVTRVPFGEWVPFRSLLEPIAGDALPDRDAYIGEEPAVLGTPAGTFGVVISWEVFFGRRARDAVGNGGEVVLNPTNGSSFSGTLVQTQQVASSQLRAVETGRWVLQAAPTGLSAVVDPGGDVRQRTDVSERAVLEATVSSRTGPALATRAGPWPPLVLAAGAVAAGWLVERRYASRWRRT